MTFRKVLFLVPFMLAPGGVAFADLPTGLWRSTPDSSGRVMHVRTRPCGAHLCGQVERMKDTRGYDTPSREVGNRVLLDFSQQADGSYLGSLWSADEGRVRTARLRVRGNEMRLENCAGNACREDVWTRLR